MSAAHPHGNGGIPSGGSIAGVKMPGQDKERMETKQNTKIVRILTVLAYVGSVSLAAVMLSLYYVFLWDPSPSASAQKGDLHVYNKPHMLPTNDSILPEQRFEQQGNLPVGLAQAPAINSDGGRWINSSALCAEWTPDKPSLLLSVLLAQPSSSPASANLTRNSTQLTNNPHRNSSPTPIQR